MEELSFIKRLILSFRQNKKLLFCLFYLLLPVPLLTPLARNISAEECCLFIIFTLLFFAVLFVTLQFFAAKTVKICCTVLLILILVPSAIFLGYLLFANAFLLTDSITSIFETNHEESKEFIKDYMNPFITAGILIYAGIPVFMISRLKGKNMFYIKHNKIAFIVCLILLSLFVVVRPVAKSVSFINFYRTFIEYKKRQYTENKMITQRLNAPFAVTTLQPDSVSQTLVVIIGESLTRHHMSLYGYGRQTNPMLGRPDSLLFIYNDVTSPQVHTIPVIRTVMSFVEREHPDYFYNQSSLFELFNRANYNTYFITNQPFGRGRATSYDILLNQAVHISNPSLQKKPDEVVFPYLQQALDDKTKKNKLIVIHLMGNHMAYKFRYPEKYNIFKNTSDNYIRRNEKFITSETIKTIDNYDNSVLYNDYVISCIIQKVKHTNTPSAVVYFSDHGEEVYDVRNFAGHAYEKVSRYMCDIPFIVWHSSTFGNYRTDLEFDTGRPFSTAGFLYSFTDLAGLRYDNFDAEKSIFNVKFKPSERYIGEDTYQEVMEMTGLLK
jgi:heptose-I-phosphate ethanolaminephosphotransferase